MTAATTRPTAVHAIRDGRFVCLGSSDCACRWYPDCECESWPCEHDAVQQANCSIEPWIDALDLCDNHRDGVAWADWPDGEVECEWTGGGYAWGYVDDELNEPPLIDDDDDAPLSIATKAGLTVFAVVCLAAMFHQELSRWWS